MDIFFSILFLIIVVPFAVAGISMAPWVPTRARDVKRVLEILELKPGEKFLEIGAGDARVSLAVARKYPQAKIYGIELALPIFIVGYMKKIFSSQKNISLKLGNAFREDFGNYDAVYVYGMPEKMQSKIVPKFLREAKKGAKLYSYVFSISSPSALQVAPPHGMGAQYEVISYGKEDEAKIHILEKTS